MANTAASGDRPNRNSCNAVRWGSRDAARVLARNSSGIDTRSGQSGRQDDLRQRDDSNDSRVWRRRRSHRSDLAIRHVPESLSSAPAASSSSAPRTSIGSSARSTRPGRAPLGNDAALFRQWHAGNLRNRRPAVRRHRRGGRQGRRAEGPGQCIRLRLRRVRAGALRTGRCSARCVRMLPALAPHRTCQLDSGSAKQNGCPQWHACSTNPSRTATRCTRCPSSPQR